MSEHLNRKKEMFHGALPPEGSLAFEKIKKQHEKDLAANPNLAKVFKHKREKATKTAVIQDNNGININIDVELRYFLREFNGRLWNHGLVSMPLMFNTMEAFFKYDKSIVYFELLPEEDYLISFFDFLDWYTSKDFNGNIESIKNDFVEDLIFNYNVGADIGEITFDSEEGEKFVIGGISMIRRGNEATILFQAGQIIDTSLVTSKLPEFESAIITPGKEKIIPNEELPIKAVKLNGNENYWKTLIICRVDLDTETLDGRLVAKDIGRAFDLTTDEIEGFLTSGEFISDDHKKAYENSLKQIEQYNPIFELSKAVLHLPSYFNNYEGDIVNEDHDTKYRDMVKRPMARREYNIVDDKFKLLSKSLFVLNRNNKFSPDRIEIKDSNFKIETSGYWKSLAVDEFGMDKKGNQVTGKTWVNKRETYYEAKTDPLIIFNTKQKNYSGPNAGYIYVLRNPNFPENTFKIGLTTKNTEERANQLSKTSVPDRFYVMREWSVADCKQAESEIHEILKEYRVDERREFFTLDMEHINQTIQNVVDKINVALS